MCFMKCMNRLKFLRAAAFVLIAVFFQILFPQKHTLELSFKGVTPQDSYAEFYYSSVLPAFEPGDHLRFISVLEDGEQKFISRLTSIQRIRYIRLDPVSVAGRFALRSVTLRGDSGEKIFSPSDIAKQAISFDQLTLLDTTAEKVHFEAGGHDPKMLFAVPREITRHSRQNVFYHWMTLLGASALCLFVVELGLSWRRRTPEFFLSSQRTAALLAARLSDEATIVFSAAAVWVYLALFTLFVGWIGLQLHQSSIGVWDDMYSTAIPESSIRIGTPRAIRSDEWNSFTPWMLSQVQNGMKVDNPNIGATASAVLTGAPIGGPLLLAQPKYWGFALLDIGHGFSWFWAFKVFGLLAAVFSLLLALTKGDVVVSMGGAIVVYGSSLVQWWFSGNAPELIMGFSMSVLGSYYLLQARKVGGMCVGALITSLVIPNLLMHIYPPHLLPLAYLAVFLVCGLVLSRQGLENFRYLWKYRVVFIGLTSVALVYMVSVWLKLSLDTIKLMLNTAYPGKRFVLGGDLDLFYVFHGIFESWKIDEWPLPFPPSNQTASSQIWPLFPIVFVLINPKRWLDPRYRTIAVLTVYCSLVLTWTTLPIPFPFRNFMAHAGWSLSPPWNSLIGMGIASLILVSVLAAGSAKGEMVLIRWPKWFVPLVVASLVMIFGIYLKSIDPEFFIIERVALASVFFGVLAWAVHQGRRWWFFALCALSAVPGLQVNPIRNDFLSYLNKDVFVQAKAAGGASGSIWAVFGDESIAQGFKSAGMTVINGTHYAPRMQVLDVLDPSHRYQDTWNRYAHIGYVSGVPGRNPVFDLVVPDQYSVALDVCGPEMRTLGVTHLAYTYAPSASEMRCLTPIPRAISDGVVRLYSLKKGV